MRTGNSMRLRISASTDVTTYVCLELLLRFESIALVRQKDLMHRMCIHFRASSSPEFSSRHV
jgi:hypothetical protein